MFHHPPKLLTGVHDLDQTDAGARAAGFALVAVACLVVPALLPGTTQKTVAHGIKVGKSGGS